MLADPRVLEDVNARLVVPRFVMTLFNSVVAGVENHATRAMGAHHLHRPLK